MLLVRIDSPCICAFFFIAMTVFAIIMAMFFHWFEPKFVTAAARWLGHSEKTQQLNVKIKRFML